MPTAYENFDLLIARGPNGYQAHATSPFGKTSVDFTLPEAELSAFLGQTLGLTRAVLVRPSSVAPPSPQEFGARLYQAVFAGPVGRDLVRSLDDVERRGLGLRIRICVDRRLTTLADLPWEYLYSPELARFLARSELTPVVRYAEEAPHRVAPLRVAPPLTVLGVVSNPRNAPPLQVEKEWGQLQSALDVLQQRGLLRLERLPKATLPELLGRLGQAPPVHMLHFIGHGFFDPAENRGGLIFEDDSGGSRAVPAETLTMMTGHPVLRLAFLNACEGAASGRSDPFAGVAQRLVQQGLPAVVAMQFPVSDRAAITLAQTFYSALAEGAPVDTALGRARMAVAAEGNALEWGTPVLFSRSDDNRLIELPQGDARPEFKPLQPYEPETVVVYGGSFLMGNDSPNALESERPPATVVLPDFRIGKALVTNRHYAVFLRDDPRPEPKRAGWRLRQPPPDKLDHPVVNVSWQDALAYCRWLSQVTGRRYRLPTEAEWEKAASWIAPSFPQSEGHKRRYPWGDDWADGRCNVAGDDTTPVGAYPGGASPYGCLDMLGNVEEWTGTLWGGDLAMSDFPYPYQPDDGREAAATSPSRFRTYRIVRGGSFVNRPGEVSCTARDRTDQADSACRWRGFRIVQELVTTSVLP